VQKERSLMVEKSAKRPDLWHYKKDGARLFAVPSPTARQTCSARGASSHQLIVAKLLLTPILVDANFIDANSY
jgi:hypothetical protein